MLAKCVEVSNLSSLSDLRILSMCLLAYAAFLRFDELHKLRRCDIIFIGTFLKIFVESSKTDIFRDGAWVLVAKSDLSTCPVKILKNDIEVINISEDCELYIFRSLTTFKDGVLRKCKKPV